MYDLYRAEDLINRVEFLLKNNLINKELFKMKEIEYKFEDWTLSELFDFVKDLHIIDPDEEIEDWDRVSLLEILNDFE